MLTKKKIPQLGYLVSSTNIVGFDNLWQYCWFLFPHYNQTGLELDDDYDDMILFLDILCKKCFP